MIEDKFRKHRDNPNRMSDTEIMVILILFQPRTSVLSIITRNMSAAS